MSCRNRLHTESLYRNMSQRRGLANSQLLTSPLEEGTCYQKNLATYPRVDHNARFLVSFRRQDR